MYRFSAVAALLLLSVATVWADDPPPADGTATTPWYKRLFGASSPPPAPPAAAPAQKPITQKDVARSLDQEQKVYLERLLFCTNLRQIAVQTNDNDLLRKADDLEQQAEQIFKTRTKSLPALLDEAKAAEAALEPRTDARPAGTASTNRVTGHYPNGKPITSQE
jgi:hypothetical protein